MTVSDSSPVNNFSLWDKTHLGVMSTRRPSTRQWTTGSGLFVAKVAVAFLIFLSPFIYVIHNASSYVYAMQATTLGREVYEPPVPGKKYEPFDKIIHHIWNDNSTIPEKWKESSQSCLDKGKDYQYMMWTPSRIKALIRTEYPWLMETYLSYNYDIQRVDVAKYMLLYHFGGIYTDLDIVCRYEWDTLLSNYSHYSVIMAESTPVGVASDTLVAKRHHPLFKFALQQLKSANRWRIVPYATIMFGTGPMYLSICMHELPSSRDDIYIIPNEVYTKQWFGNLHGGSWHQWDGVIIYWVFTHRIQFALMLASLALLIYLAIRLSRSKFSHSYSKITSNGKQNSCNGHVA